MSIAVFRSNKLLLQLVAIVTLQLDIAIIQNNAINIAKLSSHCNNNWKRGEHFKINCYLFKLLQLIAIVSLMVKSS